jgi:YD repeat-containing protein
VAGVAGSTSVLETNSRTSTTYTTSFSYDAFGALTSMTVNDGRPRTVTLTNDLNGQALRRDEADYNYSTGDPHEVWYRFGGRQLGYNGNNGTLETSYHVSIENRQKLSNNNGTGTTGAFRWGGVNGAGHADFDQSVGRINSYGQGGSGGMHSVREGDTLQSIAAQLWGDSSLRPLRAAAR